MTTITTEAELDEWAENFDAESAFITDAEDHAYVLFASEDGDLYATRPPNEDDDAEHIGKGVTLGLDALVLPLTVHVPGQPAPAEEDEVLIEGSWFPRAALPTILGNYMRLSDENAREAKAQYIARTVEQPAPAVKPGREEIARLINPRLWSPAYTGSRNFADRRPWEEIVEEEREHERTKADAILALLPGRTEGEVKAEALDSTIALLDGALGFAEAEGLIAPEGRDGWRLAITNLENLRRARADELERGEGR